MPSKKGEDIVQDEIVELNRLWIDDELKKNAESLLISKSIKLIKKKYKKIITIHIQDPKINFTVP